ncbi:MAG: hypothetical protein RIT40_179 [Planctomycetota bacterium]|jgi:hypothetical protein
MNDTNDDDLPIDPDQTSSTQQPDQPKTHRIMFHIVPLRPQPMRPLSDAEWQALFEASPYLFGESSTKEDPQP